MSTLFSSCSIFQPLRATAESVADTCSSKVVLFCVTLYVNWFPAIVSPITNKFSKKHNIIIPKIAMPIPIFSSQYVPPSIPIYNAVFFHFLIFVLKVPKGATVLT